LFVEECVRSLVNTGALTVETVEDSGTQVARRRYVCTRTPQAIALPPSVRDVIASRIDRRSPDCLATLHTLAVVDRPIPRWLAEGICSRRGADPTTTLREAVAADILIEADISPDVEYDFAHAVLREVAHDALTRPRRTEAHRDVFSLIEERYSGRLEDQSEWLAHHAVLGELWDQTGLHQGHAAERAIARGSYDEAIIRIRTALQSYERSTRSQAATERAIDQLGTLRGLLAATEVDSEEANTALARAEELARRINDRVRLAWVWADQAAQKWVAGENAEAIAKGRASLEIAEQSGDPRLRALALVRLGIALFAVGEFVEAAERLRDGRATLSGDLRFARIGTANTTSVLAGGWLVATLCELGLFDEAERTVNDIIGIAASARDVYSISSAQVARCTLAVARGQVDTAIHPLETLRTAAKAARAMQVLLFIEVLLGRAKLIAGDKSGALALLKATENPAATRRAFIDRMNQVWLAEALAANGAADEAQAILDNVEIEAKQRGEAATVVHCWAMRGKIARAIGDVTKAQAAFEGALRGAAKLSMRPVSELCGAGLAAIATPATGAPATLTKAT
jgi:tetratricopeptide (TPR) repeat protein